jgi:rare lipoprotein A
LPAGLLCGLLALALASGCASAVKYEVVPSTAQTGVASWYGPGFEGKKTSNGEVYDPTGLSAAHRTLPFGTLLRVTNLENGRTVVVRVNDRGPFVAGRDLDLSQGAAERLDMVRKGLARVRYEKVVLR